jgi:hypothetical protein
MHSCYTPTIFYGFFDRDGYILSSDCLESYSADITTAASDVVRNYACDSFIGVHAKIIENRLEYCCSEETHKALLRLHRDFEKYQKRSVPLQFMSVLLGDYETGELTSYDLPSDKEDATAEIVQ